MNQLRTPFALLLLACVVLGVFYPSYWTPPEYLDDYTLLQKLELSGGIDWSTLFLPRNNYYFRPLIAISFYLDKVLWNMTPSIMLLENTLFHLGGVWLFFFLCHGFSRNRAVCLAAAALFAVHPLAAESLNWISGRTDPMATFFHLAAALCLLKALQGRAILLPAAGAILFSAAGIATKEMSLFFVAANCLLLWATPDQEARPGEKQPRPRRVAFCLVYLAPFFLVFIAYVAGRLFLYGRNTAGLPAGLLRKDFFVLAGHSLTTLGFYLKKIVLPAPLNFAIHQVSSWYLAVGAALVVGLAGIALVRGRAGGSVPLATGGLLLLGPAVLLALTHVAWTPYAERYAYQALPFFFLAGVALVDQVTMTSGRGKIAAAVFTLLFLAASSVTWQRNLLWRNKLAFYQETVRLSPTFATVRNQLAIACFNAGMMQEGVRHLREGIRLDGLRFSRRNQLLYANMAEHYLGQGDDDEAEQTIALGVSRSNGNPSSELLQARTQLLEKKLAAAPIDRAGKIREELLAVYQTIFDHSRDPFFLFLAGKSALAGGDNHRARLFLSRAAKLAPPSAAYRNAAPLLLQKIP